MPPSGLRPIWPVASLLGRSSIAADTLPASRLATGQIGRNERVRIYEIDYLAAMLIFDAHLDLSMNALEWNRDLTRSIGEIREREKGMADKPDRGKGTVCLPVMRRGGVGLCVSTLIARIEHNAYSPVFGWRSQTQAWAQTQGQLAWYRAMEEAGQMAQITGAPGLEKHVKIWEDERAGRAGPGPPRRDETSRPADHAFSGTSPSRELPIGYILSLEGADSIVTLKHLERAYE